MKKSLEERVNDLEKAAWCQRDLFKKLMKLQEQSTVIESLFVALMIAFLIVLTVKK